MKKTTNDLQDTYIVIQSWMVTELGLKGNSLLIYALIYGFSQTEKQICTCGDEYMATWTNSSTRSVRDCKNELLEQKFIKKIRLKEDARICGYQAIRPKIAEQSSGIIPIKAENSSGIISKLAEESSGEKELYRKKVTNIPEESSRASYYNTKYKPVVNTQLNTILTRTRAEWNALIVDNCNIDALREICIMCFADDEAVDKVLNSLLNFLEQKKSTVISGKEIEFLEIAEKVEHLRSSHMCDLMQSLYVKNLDTPTQNWKPKVINNLQNYLIDIILKTA